MFKNFLGKIFSMLMKVLKKFIHDMITMSDLK